MQTIGQDFTVQCADGLTRENVTILLGEDGRVSYQTEEGQILCDDCAVICRESGTLFVPPNIADFIFYQQEKQQ